jgi:hypothetical protein
MKLKDDSLIRGQVKALKLNFSECIKVNCSLISTCQAIAKNTKNPELRSNNPFRIKCEYSQKPLIKVANLKQWSYKPFHNLTPNVFLENLAGIIAGEAPTSPVVQRCGLSCAYDKPEKTSTMILEIGRVAVDAPVRSGSTVTIESSFDVSTANTLSTTVSNATTPSTTQFSLTSVTGLSIGDRLQVVTSNGKEQVKVSNISGNLITISTTPPAPSLTVAPAVSAVVNQMISRLHLCQGTSTLNNGIPISIAPFFDTKSSSETLDFIHVIDFI